MKLIIPCAGFGSRMGMKSNESKEMLIDPVTKEPLIDWTLNLCKHNHFSPVIITRAEKTDLIEHVKQRAEVVIIEPKDEWPETVLASFDKWNDKNLLVLPDTRWHPKSILYRMEELLDFYDIGFGTHHISDPTKWGIVSGNKVCEKPAFSDSHTAWGIIAFNKMSGIDLFKGFSNRGQWFDVRNLYKLPLDKFSDITRSGVIQNYDT